MRSRSRRVGPTRVQEHLSELVGATWTRDNLSLLIISYLGINYDKDTLYLHFNLSTRSSNIKYVLDTLAKDQSVNLQRLILSDSVLFRSQYQSSPGWLGSLRDFKFPSLQSISFVAQDPGISDTRYRPITSCKAVPKSLLSTDYMNLTGYTVLKRGYDADRPIEFFLDGATPIPLTGDMFSRPLMKPCLTKFKRVIKGPIWVEKQAKLRVQYVDITRVPTKARLVVIGIEPEL